MIWKTNKICYDEGAGGWTDIDGNPLDWKHHRYLPEYEYDALSPKQQAAFDNDEDWEAVEEDEEEEDMLPDPPAEIVIPDSVTICQTIAFDSMI